MVHLTDPYMRERLSDFDDLANRLLRQLMGRDIKTIAESLVKDAIIVARSMGLPSFWIIRASVCAVSFLKTAQPRAML